ncbi:Pycsar system effector family protein [Streptomyces sp. BA2]|uniref:Pycsar system effector family protein n=1 Tax=Streptomyces sp. BA2 TaxID=436595 RepID=UPI003FA7AEAA
MRNHRRRPPSTQPKAATSRSTQQLHLLRHLQFWEPTALTQKLEQQDMLPILSNQLINMSKIAWKKHRHVQLSFILAGLGGTLVLIAGYIA